MFSPFTRKGGAPVGIRCGLGGARGYRHPHQKTQCQSLSLFLLLRPRDGVAPFLLVLPAPPFFCVLGFDWLSRPPARTSSAVLPAFLEADALGHVIFAASSTSLSPCVWGVLLPQMVAFLPTVPCVDQKPSGVQRSTRRWKEGVLLACHPPSSDAIPVPCRHLPAVPCHLSTAP